MAFNIVPVASAELPRTDDLVAVDAVLSRLFADKLSVHDDPSVIMLIELLREFIDGGKRLRPLLCCCGWRAARGGGALPNAVTQIAASLELFHAFALIQDDVMDRSSLRRGSPTVHRVLASRHPDHPQPDWLGDYAAILLGDLTLGWSYELVQAADLNSDQTKEVWSALDMMRARTLSGQYLDLVATGRRHATVEDALAIVRRKTAAYTVEYPLMLGALVGGADRDVLRACAAYGVAMGEAFQLSDDLLGVFGDTTLTGKPVIDDLREGKNTVLLTLVRERATFQQRSRLEALVGNPSLDEEGAREARSIFIATGARAAVEHMIAERCQRALSVLSSIHLFPAGTDLLYRLTHETARRQR
jgi:geranylgeranyl diphosphate synthase, type I